MQLFLRRIFPLLLLLLGLVWIVISRAEPASVTGGQIPAPQKGFLAPDFALEDLDGQTVRLSELFGKPLVVNFWASWCPPCRAEMPAMQAVHERYAGQVHLLAVNATQQDSLADARAFVNENGLTFPILLDPDGAAYRQFAITSLPTTFFIGADGVVVEVVIGGPLTEAGLRSRIESLLEETP
jgi:thiol-disulfide isomerase/thioredoxin